MDQEPKYYNPFSPHRKPYKSGDEVLNKTAKEVDKPIEIVLLPNNCLHLGLAVERYGIDNRGHKYLGIPIFMGSVPVTPEELDILRRREKRQLWIAEKVQDEHSGIRQRTIVDYGVDRRKKGKVHPAVTLSNQRAGLLGLMSMNISIAEQASRGIKSPNAPEGMGLLLCLPKTGKLQPNYLAILREKSSIRMQMYFPDPNGERKVWQVVGFKKVGQGETVLTEPVVKEIRVSLKTVEIKQQ